MPQWELPMKLLGELVLVLAIGLGWLILLARLVQGHVEGAWRYLAWSVAACPRRQPVTLIPDRDGVAARHVLRLQLRQLRSPPTPMLSRAPSACASALGVPCTSPLHCPDCDRIVPVRGHYRAGASKRSIARGMAAYDADSLIQLQDNAHARQSVTLPYCALLSNNSTA